MATTPFLMAVAFLFEVSREKGIRYLIPSLVLSAAAGTAVPFSCLQAGGNDKPASVGRVDIIDLDRLDLLKEVLSDDVSDSFLRKNLVIFAWFIQNQAQRGPGSATLVIRHPDGGDLLLIFEGFFDHFSGLLCDVKHSFLPLLM